MERLRDMPDDRTDRARRKVPSGLQRLFRLACERAIRSYRVDVALMSTTTIQGQSMFTQDEQVLRAKQAMIEIARKSILLVDESKFHFSALNHVADLSDIRRGADLARPWTGRSSSAQGRRRETAACLS